METPERQDFVTENLRVEKDIVEAVEYCGAAAAICQKRSSQISESEALGISAPMTSKSSCMPAEVTDVNVHAIAAIYGSGNEVTITGSRIRAVPILVGFTPPAMGANATAHGERRARNLRLHNETALPIVIGANTEKCQIHTNGPVQENRGKDVVVVAPLK